MDSREVVMKDTATPTVLRQQLVASTLEDPSQMAILGAPDPTAYISLPPLSFDDIHAGLDSWPAGDTPFSSTGGLGATHVSIQDIHELVGHGNPWLASLYSTPHLPSRCSKLSTQELFDSGFSAIQQCLNGSLTDSFEDVFSLVHVACALAYSLHKDEDLYDRGGLFLHILQWQYLLSNRDDVQCFLMVMGQLSCEHNYHLTYPLSGGSIFDQQTYESTFEMLRNGPVMRDCSTFLDGLAIQRLYEPNMVLLPYHLESHALYSDDTIQYMVASITTPLRDDPNTEGFHDIIDDVEARLRVGLLRNPREVEIVLIINGKSNARFSEAFENYKMAVIDSCDRAMEQPDSSWRDRYYAAAIYDVRAESVERETRQMRERQSAGQDTSVFAVVSPYQFDGASPLSVTSAESESMDDISQSTWPTTLDLSTSVSSLSTNSHNSYSTSPTTASAESPTSPAPQNPAADGIRCPLCDKPFFDRSNLRRHQTTSKAHGPGPIFPCPMDGCSRSYTRPDNLHAHLYKIHHESLSVFLQHGGAMK